jgi:holo-[acyl-carrier protein] synthase
MRMKFNPDPEQALAASAQPCGLRMGFDLVQVSEMTHSVNTFGPLFMNRFFTAGELRYAESGARDERLAARFAAKEATIKALRLSEAGIDWREIEVAQLSEGGCELVVHGRVAEFAAQAGVTTLVLSLSHDGDYAGAVVTALTDRTTRETP